MPEWGFVENLVLGIVCGVVAVTTYLVSDWLFGRWRGTNRPACVHGAECIECKIVSGMAEAMDDAIINGVKEDGR